uniref:C2H2-type domain-containing protein n=1 Tax=Glossina brevipalpis TaxID=37001 RepID=A0A1A9WVV9_9MUSC
MDISQLGINTSHPPLLYGPYYFTQEEKRNHINLLLLQENKNFHYVWIKHMSRLIKSQLTKHRTIMYMCNVCLIHFHCANALKRHKQECKKMVTQLPSIDDKYIPQQPNPTPIYIPTPIKSGPKPITLEEYRQRRITTQNKPAVPDDKTKGGKIRKNRKRLAFLQHQVPSPIPWNTASKY